jgi:hypothetical protein
MKTKAFTSAALFVLACWVVWKYGTQDWYETRGVTYQIFAAACAVIWLCIPIGACVQIVSAAFSQRVRDEIARHKLVHVMWFILSITMAFLLLAPYLFAGKIKG